MKKQWILILVVVVVTGLLGLSSVASKSTKRAAAFEQAVKDIWVEYGSYWMAGDVDNWIKLWDEGGVQLPPDTPMRMSVADIKKASEGIQAAFKFPTFVIQISGTFVDRDYGFAYGNYNFTMVPREGGDTIIAVGKYETIFKKQSDGSWKIFRDCFNSNGPSQ